MSSPNDSLFVALHVEGTRGSTGIGCYKQFGKSTICIIHWYSPRPPAPRGSKRGIVENWYLTGFHHLFCLFRVLCDDVTTVLHRENRAIFSRSIFC